MKNEKTIITIGELNIVGIKEKESQKIYIPISDLCSYLGINSNTQIRKIKSEVIFKNKIKILPIYTNSGIKNKFCLELYTLPFYLITIDGTKCKKDISEKIFKLKLESAKLLEFKTNKISSQLNINENDKDTHILNLENLVIKQSIDNINDNNEVIDDNNKKYFDFNTVAKIFNIDKKKLIEICKNFGLLKDNELPKDEYIDKKWFKISLDNVGYGIKCIVKPKTKITPLGLIRIKNILLIKGELR